MNIHEFAREESNGFTQAAATSHGGCCIGCTSGGPHPIRRSPEALAASPTEPCRSSRTQEDLAKVQDLSLPPFISLPFQSAVEFLQDFLQPKANLVLKVSNIPPFQIAPHKKWPSTSSSNFVLAARVGIFPIHVW